LDEAHQRYLHDQATDREEVRDEGRTEGIEIGLDKRNTEIALNMKNDGFGIDVISRITGLSHSEIERLN
jgi:predicted transposase/invertase (TIGR01784 family)